MNIKKAEIRMRYRVNLKKTSEGYAVWVLGLPRCWSQGKTEQEALKNIADAIKAYLQTAEELSKGTRECALRNSRNSFKIGVTLNLIHGGTPPN